MKFLKLIKLSLPLHRQTLESWIKLLDDVTKAAMIAVLPLLWLSSYSITERSIGCIVLALVVYLTQMIADKLRKRCDSLTGKEES